jgi:hypothetical protein
MLLQGLASRPHFWVFALLSLTRALAWPLLQPAFVAAWSKVNKQAMRRWPLPPLAPLLP